MKQISILFSSLALLGVILLLVLRFAPDDITAAAEEEEKKTDRQEENKVNTPEHEVVYVNTDSVMTYYELARELDEKLKQQRIRYENRIRSEEKDLVRRFEEFQKNAPTMGQFEGQRKQQELQDSEQNLYKLQDDLSQKLSKTEREYTEQIHDSLRVYLDRYTDTRSHRLVLTQTYGGAVLWGHPDADITYKVIDGLNARFRARKTDKEKEKKSS